MEASADPRGPISRGSPSRISQHRPVQRINPPPSPSPHLPRDTRASTVTFLLILVFDLFSSPHNDRMEKRSKKIRDNKIRSIYLAILLISTYLGNFRIIFCRKNQIIRSPSFNETQLSRNSEAKILLREIRWMRIKWKSSPIFFFTRESSKSGIWKGTNAKIS